MRVKNFNDKFPLYSNGNRKWLFFEPIFKFFGQKNFARGYNR